MKKKVIIMGAAGRDFHNFNVYFRGNKEYNVVAFTANQIPGIAGRKYPKELAGKGYSDGIPIYSEDRLTELIKKFDIDIVVLSYSDLSHIEVMHKASVVLASGANFMLLGPRQTMIKSKKPVISVCAVRTGAGKSPTSRKVVSILRGIGKRVVVIRHPMPYGNLLQETVQRFESPNDFEKYNSTIEEREEYEPHINNGTVVFAGVDYEKILKQAEKEADILVWDGGNNDFSFIKPDLQIVVADARRPGHEIMYYPGETNVLMADVVIVNKVDTANPKDVEEIIHNVRMMNPKAVIIKAAMPRTVDKPDLIKGKRVIVVEDGPTLTHGGLGFGAATLVAEYLGAYIVSPRQHAVGSIKQIYEKFSHLGNVLPAMGYSAKQISELEQTINNCDADLVLVGTPVDLGRILKVNKPMMKVKYELKELGKPDLEDIIKKFVKKA
jgi:predicted GTPase